MNKVSEERKKNVDRYVVTMQEKYHAPRKTAVQMAVSELLCGYCEKFWNKECKGKDKTLDYEKGYCTEFDEKK